MVNPATGDTAGAALKSRDADASSTRADVKGVTEQDKEATRKLLNTFLVVDLRAVLRAKCLAVSGIKQDLITRLIEHGCILSDRQAKEIEQLRVMATAGGPFIRLNLQDISSPEAADKWIETFKTTRGDRSRGSQMIHEGG